MQVASMLLRACALMEGMAKIIVEMEYLVTRRGISCVEPTMGTLSIVLPCFSMSSSTRQTGI